MRQASAEHRSKPGLPDAARRPSTAARNFGLDLMRVFAIGCVMLSHYGVITAARLHMPHADLFFILGVLGVDTFFVLSGFLIGNMLFNIVARGVTWKRWQVFIARRGLRVMPIYYLWLIVLVFVGGAAVPDGLRLAGYFTFTQDLAWAMPAGNWFGVSWSLTIEMWFYVAFSALALAAAHWKGLRGLAVVLAAFLLLPVIARALMPVELPWDAWVRKVTLLRLDAIAWGVLVALAMRKTDWLHRHRQALCVAGALALLATLAWWVFHVGGFALHHRAERTLLMNGFLIGGALLLPSLLRMPSPRRWLRAPVTWASEISYALYLIHLSILLWCLNLTDHHHLTLYITLPMALVLTCLLATLSRHLIEQPVLARRPRNP